MEDMDGRDITYIYIILMYNIYHMSLESSLSWGSAMDHWLSQGADTM